MSIQSTISAFQNILPNFVFIAPSSFSEEFAQKRYKKKMEIPSVASRKLLADSAFSSWLVNDESLPELRLPPGEWYKARETLHRSLLPLRLDEIQLPKGSEFIPTFGQDSIEAKLASSRWTCTRDNFDHMARVCYSHKALKRAVRRRYTRWYGNQNFDISQSVADSLLFAHFHKSHGGGAAFHIFSWKLSRCVILTQGSRFSTVPKNNEKDRPINIEGFGNILTQRAIGNCIRAEIKRLFNVDLNTLADTHRIRIRDVDEIATIDLKDASDRISLDLVRFLLPKNWVRLIEETRSPMVLGPDNNYHVIKKVSSMGNGFTFELMTLILITVCRVLDPTATVFGDDIIIDRRFAERIMHLLTSVGLHVNEEKSFIDGPFRESCGANYHKDEGYIESYDFLYPTTIGDCVVTWNKVYRLSSIYPSFKRLRDVLYRALPLVLRGGPNYQFAHCDVLGLVGKGFESEDTLVSFPLYFVTDEYKGEPLNRDLKNALRKLCYDPNDFKLIQGFDFVPDLRSKSLRRLRSHRHWAKYEMYLSGGGVVKDVIRDKGKWVSIWFVTSGTETFRVPSLMT